MSYITSALLKPAKDLTSKAQPPPNSPVDLGPIIKSPVDSKAYKAIQLPNGLKVLLVSTCQHELECGKKVKGDVLNEKIQEFNSLHLDLNNGSGGRKRSSSRDPKSSSGNKLQGSNNNNSLFSNIFNRFFRRSGADCESPEQTEKPSAPEPPNKKSKLIRCCGGPAVVGIVVGVGAFYDPVNAYGLAHLVEHLIFLGSTNYPEPNTLFTETFKHHGIANATTFAEHTMFHFTCTSDGLENCLNILIDGLVNAHLKDEVIKNEVKAIDSEYGIKQTCDATRLDDFIRSRAKLKHPMRSFYWGSADTLSYHKLGDVVREWKSRYYRADYMTACIQAPMPIQELEKMAVAQFSIIPTSDVSPSSSRLGLLSRGSPFDENDFYTSYQITPLTHATCLVITWFLPAKFWMDYKTKPLHYMRQMLSANSPGSLVSFFKAKGWLSDSNSVEVNCKCSDNFCRNSFGSLFSMKFSLTDKGYANRHDVVSAIFSYLKLIKTRGVSKSTFQEMQRTQADYFHFQNWEEMIDACLSAAMVLQEGDVPAQHVLTSQSLSMEYDTEKIQECLTEMSPRRANILFVSSKNQEVCKKKAWACKIRYNKEDFTEKRYKELENIKIYPEFQLPPKKYFESQKITLGKNPEPIKKAKDFESERLSIRFLDTKKNPCLSRQVPSARYLIEFSSPYVLRQTRIKEGMLDLWIKLAVDNIIESIGHRFNEFISCNDMLDMVDTGLCVDLSGPSCYLPEILKIVVDSVFDLMENCNETKFENCKKDFIRMCANHTFDTEFLCKDLLTYLQLKSHSSIFQVKQHAEELTFESFGRLTSLFKHRMKVKVELQGDVFESDRNSIIQLLDDNWFKPVTVIPSIAERSTIIPKGNSVVSVQGIHPGYITSAVMNYYQVGISDFSTWELTYGIYRALKRRLPNQLRTVEQLGYTVQLKLFDGHGSIGLMAFVLTHPHKFSTEYVDSRVDDCFRAFYKILSNEEKRMKLFLDYFQGDMRKIEELKKFYADHFLPGGKHFKKLSVQVSGYDPDTIIGKKLRRELRGERKDDDDGSEELIQLEYLMPEDNRHKRTGYTIVENVYEFKNGLPLYPVRGN